VSLADEGATCRSASVRDAHPVAGAAAAADHLGGHLGHLGHLGGGRRSTDGQMIFEALPATQEVGSDLGFVEPPYGIEP
jgi:hypothetical protein